MPPARSFIGLLVICGAVSAGAEDLPTPEQVTFFETKVRPLLADRCFSCHGPDKQKSALRLDSRAALLAGGDAGPAVEPGKPDASLLIDAVNYKTLQMPPDRRLSVDEIGILTKWVKEGAPWPGSGTDNVGPSVRKKGLEITDADRQYWAFQPVRRTSLPGNPSAATTVNPIDSFLQAKLAEQGLTYSPPADHRTRLRRLTFDLWGLPPDAADVAAFAADPSPDAYDRLVDTCLASPAYGERWGRHWLDLVRFAQTNGYERDDEKTHVWRYRDYVITSLNADKPYDQFVREQLAGDELDAVTDESMIATGYYRLGVWDDEPDDARQAEFDELDDMLSTTGSVFLGLTLGCARCHDHKFDPLSQEDYYSLLGFIRNVKRYSRPDDKAVGTVLAELKSGGKALAVFEQGINVPAVHVLARGNAGTPGKEVSPRFPAVFGPDLAAVTPSLLKPAEGARTSGRRRVLADWLTDPRHPLTARVIVNRLWHVHFGKGLVPTPSDFGHTGLPCSHPELLDYLASELIHSGWSLKHMHRLILTSAAYQQSSRNDRAEAVAADPGNQWLWRQNFRRMEAEAIRDATLAVSGTLNRELYGRGVFPELSAEVLSTQSRPGSGWDKSPKPQQARRSVYIFVKRTLGVPMLESFDAASPDTSQSTRGTTTIAPQALILLNGAFADEQAAAFAQRLLADDKAEETARIRQAFELAVTRPPTDRELQFAVEYLARQREFLRENAAALQELTARQSSDTAPLRLAGWTTYGGKWSLPETGVCAVEPAPGAKVIRDDVVFGDGSVECQVKLDQGGDGGVLIRVNNPQDGTDAVNAYNINFTPTSLRLGKHQQNWKELKNAPARFTPGEWVTLRVSAEKDRLQIFLNEAKEPAIDYIDPEPLPAGKLGFRTFQAKVSYRALKVRQGEKSTGIPLDRAAEAASIVDRSPYETLAWTALAKILLNLNEFVYVD